MDFIIFIIITKSNYNITKNKAPHRTVFNSSCDHTKERD